MSWPTIRRRIGISWLFLFKSADDKPASGYSLASDFKLIDNMSPTSYYSWLIT